MISSSTNQYLRRALDHIERPSPIEARFFYTNPIPIDDPLSPVPPSSTSDAPTKQPPKPFSQHDNAALEEAWQKLRQTIRRYEEQRTATSDLKDKKDDKRRLPSTVDDRRRSGSSSNVPNPKSMPIRVPATNLSHMGEPPQNLAGSPGQGSSYAPSPESVSLPDTTGTPFIRAPSRSKLRATQREDQSARPKIRTLDTHQWDDTSHLADHSPAPEEADDDRTSKPTAQVVVGVSRLHQVEMPNLQMTPIYWTPVHDTASVIRGTWFYQDTMLPVETAVANMLEAGYIDLRVWTETWADELNSAVEAGAAGEMKIVHKLWPEKPSRKTDSRPTSKRGTSPGEGVLRAATSMIVPEEETPEQVRAAAVDAAGRMIDIASGPDGTDNKASGMPMYGWRGLVRTFASFGVIYASKKEARLLRTNLLPSAYYGRRPLANYIRKGYKLGIPVVRGFDQAAWDKLYPAKPNPRAKKAEQGAAIAAAAAPNSHIQVPQPASAPSFPLRATDLVLIVHGIGQKWASRYESFHFTHAINSFRREINVELGSKEIRARLRQDVGGIMALPINWRHSLTFEEGGYRDDDPAVNEFSLKDITPDTLPSVRNIVSDVMLDIPYYLSHHQPKMVAAVVHEANRVYQLWCKNNPDFVKNGRVHIIAHSLGSVMAVDILSRQPTVIPEHLEDPASVDLSDEHLDHFLFNTSNLFLAGSPAGFFLLLKKAQLLPRIDYLPFATSDDAGLNSSSICGERGQYGCLAVENIYNVINPYDPVAYRMNAAVDTAYSASLKQATIPSATPGWFGVGTKSSTLFGGTSTTTARGKPPLDRLPSNVEMETHNFTREEIAEKRMHLLNDNGQIDFFLRYGGGAFEIQYLTMLSAHSSYWLLKDFVRMVVTEVGRERGTQGTFLGMRAVKKKKSPGG